MNKARHNGLRHYLQSWRLQRVKKTWQQTPRVQRFVVPLYVLWTRPRSSFALEMLRLLQGGPCSVVNQTGKNRCRFRLAVRGGSVHSQSLHILRAVLTVISLNQRHCCCSTYGALPSPSFPLFQRSFSERHELGHWFGMGVLQLANDDRQFPPIAWTNSQSRGFGPRDETQTVAKSRLGSTGTA